MKFRCIHAWGWENVVVLIIGLLGVWGGGVNDRSCILGMEYLVGGDFGWEAQRGPGGRGSTSWSGLYLSFPFCIYPSPFPPPYLGLSSTSAFFRPADIVPRMMMVHSPSPLFSAMIHIYQASSLPIWKKNTFVDYPLKMLRRRRNGDGEWTSICGAYTTTDLEHRRRTLPETPLSNQSTSPSLAPP